MAGDPRRFRRRTRLAALLLVYIGGYLGARHFHVLVHRTAFSRGDVFHHVAVGNPAFRTVPSMRPLVFLIFYPGVAAESIGWALLDPGPKHQRKEMMLKIAART